MSADPPAHDPALGRRALITGAAVLGAAGVASIASASDAGAADGSTMKVGRQDNEGNSPTRVTVGTYRRPVIPEPPGGYDGFVVSDKRGATPTHLRAALSGVGSDTGVAGSGHFGMYGRGESIGVRGSSDAGYGMRADGGERGIVADATRAAGIGAEATASGTGGTGVKGVGDGVGVDGRGGIGVRGTSTASVGVKGVSTSGTGVEGTTTSGAQAVLGAHPATTGNATGVRGTSASATGVGVMGVASHASGVTQGVRGDGTASPLGTGVTGLGQANGVYGESRKVGGKGVFGLATQADGTASHGVYGQTASTTGAGVYGKSPSYDPDLAWNVTSYGVYADGAIASSGPAFLGVPEYGTTARSDSRLQEGTMTFSADFTTGSPKLIVLVKNTDGRLFKAELPLTAI